MFIKRLNGRIALVTGAGRGIGQSIALRLAQEGASVIVNDIILTNAESVAEDIKKMGQESLAIYADISKPDDVRQMFEQIKTRFGSLDILVNNAGCTQNVSVLEMKDEDWDRILKINLYGVFYCSKAAIKLMIPNNYGKIVSISSVAGKQGGGVWGAAHYSAAKAGIIGFTKKLAKEVAQNNITVNAIAPGVIEIPIENKKRLKVKADVAKKTPIGRQGRPEEVAAAVSFLSSDDSSFITGETINVNGGLYMD